MLFYVPTLSMISSIVCEDLHFPYFSQLLPPQLSSSPSSISPALVLHFIAAQLLCQSIHHGLDEVKSRSVRYRCVHLVRDQSAVSVYHTLNLVVTVSLKTD